eukprot:1137999-Pelagomonas_calceolata.AAC.6
MADFKISNAFWHVEAVILKEQTDVKHQTDTFTMRSMPEVSPANLAGSLPLVWHLTELPALYPGALIHTEIKCT